MADNLQERNDLKIYFGGAIKALPDGLIEGIGVPYTSPEIRDLHSEYFNTETDHVENDFRFTDARIHYNHGLDEKMSIRNIGKTVKAERSEAGVWLQAQLNMADEYEQMIYEMAQSGKLHWSSGALPQSVIVDDDGHIKRWAVIEFSLTPTPAMPHINRITTTKSLQPNQLSESTGRKEPTGVKGDTATVNEAAQPNGAQKPIVKTTPNMEKTKMELEEEKQKADGNPADALMSIAEQLVALAQSMGVPQGEAVAMADEVVEEAKADGVDPEKDPEEAAEKMVKRLIKKHMDRAAKVQKFANKGQSMVNDYLKAQPSTQQLPAFTGGNPRIRVGENLKFAHMSASDMALGVLMRAAPFKSQGMPFQLGNVVSPDYLAAMAAKMVSHSDSMPYGKSAKSATQFEIAQKANFHLKSIMATKANELDASTLAGQGDEWVGEFWSTDLWERERFARHYDTMVSKGMWVQTIERGSETAYFPTEGSDPVAYVSPQANSTDATGRPETTININPFGTGRVSITPSEIKIATSHTTILDEDSVINIVQTVNRQLNEAAMETRDKLMVNGDVETGTTNINKDGVAPATGLQTPYYIASNGFRKTGLAGGRDALNVLNLAQYRLTLGEIDPELRQYYEKMVFMIDPTTELASLAIAELATDDVRRTAATVTSGRLINIHGVDVLVNGFLPSTDTDGKVTSTGNVSERGTIMLVYAPYWGVAYKRQVTLETARDIYSGSNVYVLSMRIGFVPRGANAAATSYNVALAAS